MYVLHHTNQAPHSYEVLMTRDRLPLHIQPIYFGKLTLLDTTKLHIYGNITDITQYDQTVVCVDRLNSELF